jgi:hypothetical protein
MDFPHGQDKAAVMDWLNISEFDATVQEKFKKYNADALMGLEKDDIIELLGQDEGLRLWALLHTAKQKALELAQSPSGRMYM